MGKRWSARASIEKDQELVIDIPNDLEPVFWPQCCIYNVPWDLRKLNEEVYTPHLISIGPLHHDNEKLPDMERQKLIYLREFCKRTEVTLNDFVSILKKDEELIRQCYEVESELCSNEYVMMILLDAVFIIELFMRYIEGKNPEVDYMLNLRWLNTIQKDLLLLENQLPYFVLNDLYKSAFSASDKPSFHTLTCTFFAKHNPGNLIIADQTGVLHFTDLLRHFMSGKCEHKNHGIIQNLPSAAKLHEAGVTFKGIEMGCLTDISFDKGKLIMPQFKVVDSTELVIRNLMALEQCHYPQETYICDYISLMDFLINTAKDVDLLVEKGVIVNWVGSNEAAANMVNKLCINTYTYNFYFYDIGQDLNKHYKKRRHRAMKTLRSVYFANIWRGTSTVAAVILLVMTLLQTINSFRQLP